MARFKIEVEVHFMKKAVNICPAIAPMPVILIATYNDDGTIDVMNAAWGTAFDFTQIELNISDNHRTTENIRKRKAFTVSLSDASNVVAADFVGIVSNKKDQQKFAKTMWKAHKSDLVDAPILDDLPYSMECTLECFKEDYGIIGNIKRLLVEERCLDEKGKPDISKMKLICYDPFQHGYYVLGEKVGQAFSDGKKLIK